MGNLELQEHKVLLDLLDQLVNEESQDYQAQLVPLDSQALLDQGVNLD